MNKPFYIIIFLLLFCCEAKTQTEYITNGSFEQIDSCYGCTSPIGFDVFEWSGCKGWNNPIASSSDLWCTNGKICFAQPPNNGGVGYQYSRTGNIMSGILINDGLVKNYREYIENKLVMPLKLGVKYELSFYVSCVNPTCSSAEFGAKFYTTNFYDNTKFWLTDIVPDAINDYTKFVVDTLGWQLVKIPYIANGNESFVVIGNFEDSTKIKNTWPCDTTLWNNQHLAGNYFFIDDVSIKEAPFEEPVFANVFSPNKDHVNDIWSVDLSYFQTVNCTIYNRWGYKVYGTTNPIILWDGNNNNGSENTDGCYFFIIEAISSEKEKKVFKGFIQLVR